MDHEYTNDAGRPNEPQPMPNEPQTGAASQSGEDFWQSTPRPQPTYQPPVTPAADAPQQTPFAAPVYSSEPPSAPQQTPYQTPVRGSETLSAPQQTPYQTPVRGSDDQPVYHDEAHQTDTPSFAPGSQSYETFRQWQEQETKRRGKHAKKKRSKKPLLVAGAFAAACALFFGGIAIGGLRTAESPAPAAPENKNLPVLSIADTPTGSGTVSSDGVMAGEDIYKKLCDSIVAIQTMSQNGRAASSGSGVVMSSDGYIITNAHVILNDSTGQPMSSVSVLFADGSQLDASVVGFDEQTDLAVIKVEPESALLPAEFGDSDALQVGETAYAIGSPGGIQLANSMTSGIISAINRDITVNDRVMTLIQTNVTINPGNSGGALINKYGQVVGITSAKLGISYYEGLGFAIPINSAKDIIDELIQTGYITGRPSIGITGQNITAQASQFYNLPAGVQIVSIDSRAKAANEGLAAGDVITAVNGQSITTMDEINKIKENMKAGDSLTLTVYRPSTQKSQDFKITLTDAHDLEGADPAQQNQQNQQQYGSDYYGNGGYFDPFRYFFGY